MELKDLKNIQDFYSRKRYSSDSEWQEYFNFKKLFIKPSKEYKLCGKYMKERIKETDEENTYDRKTNWQNYCFYINGVLGELRKGHHDYCHYEYQVMELARFLPSLKTKFVKENNGGFEYWEVWI